MIWILLSLIASLKLLQKVLFPRYGRHRKRKIHSFRLVLMRTILFRAHHVFILSVFILLLWRTHINTRFVPADTGIYSTFTDREITSRVDSELHGNSMLVSHATIVVYGIGENIALSYKSC